VLVYCWQLLIVTISCCACQLIILLLIRLAVALRSYEYRQCVHTVRCLSGTMLPYSPMVVALSELPVVLFDQVTAPKCVCSNNCQRQVVSSSFCSMLLVPRGKCCMPFRLLHLDSRTVLYCKPPADSCLSQAVLSQRL
jgi:hypothetical protein